MPIVEESNGKPKYLYGLDNDISTVWLFLNNRGKLLTYINENINPKKDEVIEILEMYSFFKDPTCEIIYKNSNTKITIPNNESIKKLDSGQKSETKGSHIDIRESGRPLINLILRSKINLEQTGKRRFEILSSYIDSSPY